MKDLVDKLNDLQNKCFSWSNVPDNLHILVRLDNQQYIDILKIEKINGVDENGLD